jgi:hypothetical protein
MSAATVIAELEEAGIVVEAVAGRLRLFNPIGPLPTDAVDAARRHKPEILGLLARRPVPSAQRNGDAAIGPAAGTAQVAIRWPVGRRVQQPDPYQRGPIGEDAAVWRGWMQERFRDRLRLGWERHIALSTTWG